MGCGWELKKTVIRIVNFYSDECLLEIAGIDPNNGNKPITRNIKMNELNRWEAPDSYAGHNPIGDYTLYGRTRDSSIMENSNYELILEELMHPNKLLIERRKFKQHYPIIQFIQMMIILSGNGMKCSDIGMIST